MKATGIVRRIDPLGRFVIPSEIRKLNGMEKDTPVEVFIDGDAIILRKYKCSCELCGTTDDVVKIDNVSLCKNCASKFI